MVRDCGVTPNARNRAVSVFFFVPSVSLSVKRLYVVYGLSTSLSPAMLHFKILM